MAAAEQQQQFQLATLDEEGVASLFASLGYPFYGEQVKEHGITGPILSHLDHTSLRDLGIASVGQRLAILRAVWVLKVEQGVPVEEGGFGGEEDAVLFDTTAPVGFGAQGGALAGGQQRGPTPQILNLLGERDDRILHLEHEVQKLHETLLSLREDVFRSSTSSSKQPPRPSVRSPTFPSTFIHSTSPSSSAPPTANPNPHPLSNQSTLARSTSTSTHSHIPKPLVTHSAPSTSSGALSPLLGSNLPDSPNSPIIDSPRLASHGFSHSPAGVNDSTSSFAPLTPTTPTASVSFSSSSLVVPASSGGSRPGSGNTEGGREASSTASSGGGGGGGRGELGLGLGAPRDRERERHRDRERERDVSSSTTSSNLTTNTTNSDRDKDKDKDKVEKAERTDKDKSADNPYRSFRVTVEDPCHKVLPAALKKYKINDDWRQYALFICYGNTERCLAYDEKPLLLFQRLKESNNNPVFMLRHIKDIKSPIAVASAKHAARRGAEKRAAGVGAGTEERKTVNRDGVAVQPPASRPTRLHHPPVLLPVGKDKEGGGKEEKKDEHGPPPSPRETPGYCISIYPYLAEREDEFDVTVGDTFVIISKTKGWWVVYRDLAPTYSSDLSTPRKSAWVPAGCLLETSVPPLSLAPSSLDVTQLPPGNAATVPIEPQYVVSVSTPNVALMDYEKQGSDELEVRKGTSLRILKRYNHWSYAIKDDGQRGWIPSWFCGRAARAGDGTPTTPTTAEGRAASSALSAPLSSSSNNRDRSPSSAAPSAIVTTSAAAAPSASSVATSGLLEAGDGSAVAGPKD